MASPGAPSSAVFSTWTPNPAEEEEEGAKQPTMDAAWYPSPPGAGFSALLLTLSSRGPLTLWDAASQRQVAELASLPSVLSPPDLRVQRAGGQVLVALTTRSGVHVLREAEAGTPAAQEGGDLATACATVGMRPLTRAEAVYAEPVDSTLLCDCSVSSDGRAVLARPVPGQAGHFNTGLFIFSRGQVGDMVLKQPPRAPARRSELVAAAWSRGPRAALAALTRSGTALVLAQPHPCVWAGPMFPPQFQLYPGNKDFAEPESLWDVRDEQGRPLQGGTPIPPQSDPPHVDVLTGRRPGRSALQGAVSPRPQGLAGWGALPHLTALPPFMRAMDDVEPLRRWAEGLNRSAQSAAAAAATGGSRAQVGGVKRPRMPPADSTPSWRGGGVFRTLLSRVHVAAPAQPEGADAPSAKAAAQALARAVEQATGLPTGPLPSEEEEEEGEPGATGGGEGSRQAPRVQLSAEELAAAAREEELAKAVGVLVHLVSGGTPLEPPSQEEAALLDADDGLYAGSSEAAAAEELGSRPSKQLLGLLVMQGGHAAVALRAAGVSLSGPTPPPSQAALRQEAIDAASQTLEEVGLTPGGGLDTPPSLLEAEEAAYAFHRLVAAKLQGRPRRPGAALDPRTLLSEEERKVAELRAEANRHRSRILSYSSTHAELNRAWGIAVTPPPVLTQTPSAAAAPQPAPAPPTSTHTVNPGSVELRAALLQQQMRAGAHAPALHPPGH